jgi:hypothetical protein
MPPIYNDSYFVEFAPTIYYIIIKTTNNQQCGLTKHNFNVIITAGLVSSHPAGRCAYTESFCGTSYSSKYSTAPLYLNNSISLANAHKAMICFATLPSIKSWQRVTANTIVGFARPGVLDLEALRLIDPMWLYNKADARIGGYIGR